MRQLYLLAYLIIFIPLLLSSFTIVETFNETLRLLREYGFENIDVSVLNVSKLEKLGRGEYFKPLNPIYIISCEKGRD